MTRAHGALLISDEVMTGFRCSAAGWYGLEGPYDEGPADLFTFGKVMGGGFPAAAFGGRADVMAMLAPLGPVYQAGTLSGNPVATAAGLATLRGCTPEVYDRLDVVSKAIASAVTRGAGAGPACRTSSSGPAACSRSSSATATVRNYDDAKAQNSQAFTAFFHSMLSQGVHLPPSAFESWFVSAAHDDAAVDRVIAPCPPRPARSQTRLRHSGHEPCSSHRHHGRAPAAPR